MNHPTTNPPPIEEELSLDLARTMHDFTARADTHTTRDAVRTFTHAHDVLTVTRFTDTQRHHLTQQLRTEPARGPTEYFTHEHQWNAHGRTVTRNATPYTIPTADNNGTLTVYVYTDTQPKHTAKDIDVFTAIHPSPSNTAAFTPRGTEVLYNAVVDAAETGAFPSPHHRIPVGTTGPGGDLDLNAAGESFGGRVRIREYLTELQAIRVLTHEYAHEYFDHMGGFDDEIDAEIIAYTVCKALGIELEQSEQYVRFCANHHVDTPTTEPVREAVRGRVPGLRDAAGHILAAITKQHANVTAQSLY